MTPSAPPVGRRGHAALWLGCFLAGALLTPGFNSFESPPYDSVVELLHQGRFGLTREPLGIYHLGPDGLVYEVHEIGSALFALPLAFTAERVAGAAGLEFKRVYELLLGFASAALFATTVLLLLRLGRRHGIEEREAAPRLLILLAASQYLVYATSPPDVSIATPLLAGCVLAWTRAHDGSRLNWLIAGLLAGLLFTVKITTATVAVVLLLLSLEAAWSSRPRSAWPVILALLGLIPGLVITGWWNTVRTGSPLHTPYPAALHGFQPSVLPLGLVSALVSPNKGMLAYTPVLVLLAFAFRRGGTLRQHPRFAALAVGSFLLSLVRVSGTLGGSSFGGWGNRYYVPWIPLFLLVLAVEWRRGLGGRRLPQIVGVIAIVAGALVNVAGIVTNQMYRQQLCGFDEWTWRGMNVCAARALPANIARTVGLPVPEVVVPGASEANVHASNRLAVWWYAVRYAGAAASLSWAIGCTLLVGAATGLRWGLRGLPSPAPPGTT
jgi:hypothetical protein